MHEQVWKIFGKKYAASGLEDIPVEANVFGANAASVIISLRNLKQFRTFKPFKFSNARFFYPYKQWKNFRTRPSFVR